MAQANPAAPARPTSPWDASAATAFQQVLCEFKDIRSGLDARQLRKNNHRSPVEQCFDYLQSSWQSRAPHALTEPFFALVTDMNEFRLYARRLGRWQFQRFALSGPASATDPTLLADTPAAAFRRFVFCRLFQPDMLLAERGASQLDRLLHDQVVREKTIEKKFYREYHDYREFVYSTTSPPRKSRWWNEGECGGNLQPPA